jgi:hypothetical protein
MPITLVTGIMMSFGGITRFMVLRLLWRVDVDRTPPRMRIRGFQRFKAGVGGILVMAACMTWSMVLRNAGVFRS